MNRNIIGLLLVMILLISGCSGTKDKIRDIKAEINDRQIELQAVEDEDKDAALEQYIIEYPVRQMDIAEIGEQVKVSLAGMYEEVYLYEHLLTKEGKRKYSEKTTSCIAAETSIDAFTFEIEENYAVYLSSDMDDYQKGNTIRGYVLELVRGSEKIQYVFVLRT